MASCDASCKFTSVYVRCSGRKSDGDAFASPEVGRYIENGHENVLAPIQLPNGGPVLSYLLVGGDALPLKLNLMKPYSGVRAPNTAKRVLSLVLLK